MRPVYRSKNAMVYDAIKASILHGDLKPGQRLVIDELAAGMGVSQIPVREALRQLEADGFVQIEPYVGATVTELQTSFMSEIFAVLEGLEIISSRAACQQMTADELAKLEAIIIKMDSLVEDPDQWSEENKRLHRFICECARMALVGSMMATALDHWDRVRLYYLQNVFGHRIAVAQQDHHRILEGFKARNPDAVERAVREHNRDALAAYMQQLHSQKDAP